MVIPDINIPDIDEDSSDDEDDEEEQKNILAIFQKLQQAKSSIEENKKKKNREIFLNEVQEEFEFEQRQIIDDLARKRNADSTKLLTNLSHQMQNLATVNEKLKTISNRKKRVLEDGAKSIEEVFMNLKKFRQEFQENVQMKKANISTEASALNQQIVNMGNQLEIKLKAIESEKKDDKFSKLLKQMVAINEN